MKQQYRSFIVVFLFIATFALVFIHFTPLVHADAATTVNLSVSSSCQSEIDGDATTSYTDIAPNSTATITVNNGDSLITQDITSSDGSVAPTSVAANSSTSIAVTASTSPVTLTFTPVPLADPDPGGDTDNCPTSDAAAASSLLVNPAGATLSCSLEGSNWYLTGGFTGSSAGTGVYNNATIVGPAITSAGGINRTVPATATAQTFTVLDGTSYGGKGTSLASTTCPAYTPNSKAASGSTTTTTMPNSTSTSSNGSLTSGDGAVPNPTATTIYTTTKEKLKANDTGAILESTAGLVLVIIVILAILDIAGAWTFPRRFIVRLWKKLRHLRHKKQPGVPVSAAADITPSIKPPVVTSSPQLRSVTKPTTSNSPKARRTRSSSQG